MPLRAARARAPRHYYHFHAASQRVTIIITARHYGVINIDITDYHHYQHHASRHAPALFAARGAPRLPSRHMSRARCYAARARKARRAQRWLITQYARAAAIILRHAHTHATIIIIINNNNRAVNNNTITLIIIEYVISLSLMHYTHWLLLYTHNNNNRQNIIFFVITYATHTHTPLISHAIVIIITSRITYFSFHTLRHHTHTICTLNKPHYLHIYY